MKDKSSLEKIYKSYSDLYTARGDYKKALAYYKLYSETEDDLINAEKNKQIAELQEQFEAERRAKEIDILKKDNKIQKITRNAFIIGFILVLIILILLFKKYLYLFSFWKKQKYIGHYRIIETIGSGGMGTIYHAHSLRDKTQSAAIKVLKDELTKDENNRQRFKHEGTIIDKLDHPNIIKIYERGEYKEKLYLAMEFLQGKTLAQKMEEEGKIDLKECLYIMVQITDALVLIHSKNIVHRDLKPSNIMLIEKDGDPNFVKLLDFGLAKMKFQTRLTSTGILIGTINYVAPEQITDSLYSSASDIYALGIIFYQMITGNQAFSGDTITNIVEKILDTKPLELNRIRSEIPGELNHLITQMLSKKPGQRPLAEKVLTSLKKISNDFG
jgi:serine/threonine-protein kinase